MDRFSKLNPKTSFVFFLSAIALSLVLFNPVLLLTGFLCSFFYNIKLDGKRAVSSFFKFIFPLVLFVAVFNMLFSHYGETVLFAVKEYTFTLESLFYGFCQGLLFATVVMWFTAYSKVITSDRFLSIFGKIAPNSSMIFSVVLSFIPRMKRNAREISDARKLICGENKLQKSLADFSALVSLTLEESIEVSDSMKARGFCKERKPYSKYRFKFIDAVILAVCVLLCAVLLYLKVAGKTEFIFEPVMSFGDFSKFAVLIYFIFSALPLIIDFSEDLKWLYLKQKI